MFPGFAIFKMWISRSLSLTTRLWEKEEGGSLTTWPEKGTSHSCSYSAWLGMSGTWLHLTTNTTGIHTLAVFPGRRGNRFMVNDGQFLPHIHLTGWIWSPGKLMWFAHRSIDTCSHCKWGYHVHLSRNHNAGWWRRRESWSNRLNNRHEMPRPVNAPAAFPSSLLTFLTISWSHL